MNGGKKIKQTTNSNGGDVAEPVAVVQLLIQRVMNYAFISMAGGNCVWCAEKKKKFVRTGVLQ